MLTLYRKRHCPACDEIETQLQEQTLACKVIVVDSDPASTSELPFDAEPPVLRDGDETYAGSQAVSEHVDRVAQIKDRWQQHGADACYCDEDGEVL